jgi:hypothetical protein
MAFEGRALQQDIQQESHSSRIPAPVQADRGRWAWQLCLSSLGRFKFGGRFAVNRAAKSASVKT